MEVLRFHCSYLEGRKESERAITRREKRAKERREYSDSLSLSLSLVLSLSCILLGH